MAPMENDPKSKAGRQNLLQPSARSMDLEYPEPEEAGPAGQAVEPPEPPLTKCPTCSSTVHVTFAATLIFWGELLAFVARETGVSELELIQTGSRPSAEAHQARIWLVQLLERIAGLEDTKLWLQLLGFTPRWISQRLKEECELDVNVDLREVLEI